MLKILARLYYRLVTGITGINPLADPVGSAVAGGVFLAGAGSVPNILHQRITEPPDGRSDPPSLGPDLGQLFITNPGSGGRGQSGCQPAAGTFVPDCLAKPLHLPAAGGHGRGRGHRILQVVGLVDDQVEIRAEAGVGRQQGMVEYRYIRLFETLACPTVEIEFIQFGLGRTWGKLHT